jgi:2-iminobutanoate/2-iminopropanoate deaminase
MLNRVSTSNAPAAIGPYSQAVWAGNFLYLSGMMPIDPATGALEPADITVQAARIMKNIEAVLSEAGLTQENVVKTTCFLSDMGNFAAFNAVYGEYFSSKPARSCVAVRELPKSALVEVEVIAYKG